MESTANIITPDIAFNEPPIVFVRKTKYRLAIDDILDGFRQWQIWLLIAYMDIRLRYRRSVLGPFWVTLSMMITVYSMGYLYSSVFHSDLNSYFPYLTAGMIGWALVSNSIMELTDTYTNYEGLVKQIKLPFMLYIHRVSMRNIFIFFHNLIVIVPVLILFHQSVNANMLLLIPALAVFYINALSYGLILAILGARYRDVSQMIKSMVQVIFFVTPIMWKPDVLSANKQLLVHLNPMNSFLEMIRAPLLGTVPSNHDLKYVLLITVAGILLSFFLFARVRSRIVYWL